MNPRQHLLAALRWDPMGPFDPDSGQEVFELPLIGWYPTGFLVAEASAHDEAASSGVEPSSDNVVGDGPEAKYRPLLPVLEPMPLESGPELEFLWATRQASC